MNIFKTRTSVTSIELQIKANDPLKDTPFLRGRIGQTGVRVLFHVMLVTELEPNCVPKLLQ